MRFTTLPGTASMISLIGCQLGSGAPDPQWLSDFQNTDTIVIQKNQHELTITDRDTINRLHDIYSGCD